MSISIRQFKAQFPEFRTTPDAVISRGLSDALLQINVSLWGTKADLGQKYLAADLIALSPPGEKARLKKNENITTYEKVYNRLKMQVTVGVGRNT